MNNNVGIISFSFDDGRIDNYEVAVPILRKYGIKATFNITTGFVDGTWVDITSPVPAMSKENVRELYNDDLFEIAGHGDKHQNDFTDISNGINKLSQWLNDGKKFDSIGFASPGSDFHASRDIEEQLASINIKYVRSSCRYTSYKMLKIFSRKVSRVIKSPLAYRLGYMDTCFDKVDDLYIYSIPVLHQVTFYQLKAIVDYVIKNGKAVIFMLHSVAREGSIGYNDNWTMDATVFERLCATIVKLKSEGKCEVMTTMELVNTMTKGKR